MIKTLLILLAFGVITHPLYSQYEDNSNEPHAIFLKPFHFSGQSLLDASVFTNQDLSGNSFPQNEPSVRISTKNPNIIVAAWRDFRLGVSPAERRIGYTRSTDGGLTWAVSQLLPDPNPDHDSQSDPVIACDSAGDFYISSTSRQPVSGFNREMLIYKSTNDGQTFSYFSTAVPGSGGAGEDKEWIFFDPVQTNTTYNNIFISWTSFGPSRGIKFRKSSNSGLNWTSTVSVSTSTSAQGSNVCSGTNGEIYIVWWQSGIRFDKSTNGGTSFGTDQTISSVSSSSNGSFPFICVDYSNGARRGDVYVVFADERGGNEDVWFQRSTDAGATWLANPIRVNDVTTGDQFWPVVRCDANGDLYVVYYDQRSGFNSYIARSTDGGNTWLNDRLSDVSFFGNTPNSDVRYGDYINMDVYNGRVVPVWTDDRAGGDNQEIYSAIVDFPAGITHNPNVTPGSYRLYQNYPNPFNPSTLIKFDIPERAFVSLTIYDAVGREIGSPIRSVLSAGGYSIEWNAGGLSSGVYFYRINAGNFSEIKKMLLIK